MVDTPWFVLRGSLDGSKANGQSPDIILGSPKPDAAYTQQYDKAFNRTGKFPGANYVYVRAENRGDDLAVGSVNVYAVRLASLAHQGEWLLLHTSDGRNSTNIHAEGGKDAVNGVPLIWEPGEAPPEGAPWCLIAQLTGDNQSPVKVPATVKDKAGFDVWIATQPRLAYVIVETPKVVPVEAPTFSWQRQIALSTEAETTLNVSLICTHGEAGGFLAYSFDKPDSSGQAIGYGKTRYQVNTSYSQSRKIPAGFNSTVTISYTPAADENAAADFAFQVSTEDEGGDDGDLGTSTPIQVASYTLSFGQTRSAT